MDLSVPVSAMAANEMKRREKAEKPAETAVAPVVRRRGRPPRSAKTAAAQPNA